MKSHLTAILIVLIALAAGPISAASRVLVVINQNSPASVEVGDYYVKKRHISAKFVCRLRTQLGEGITMDDYSKIRADIRSHLTKNALKDKIDYIVLTKGVPIRANTRTGAFSVDSMLTLLWTDVSGKYNNPYFKSTKRFSYAGQGFYLVTRLDGYTVADAKKLVDRSLAAKPRNGLFLFDIDKSRDGKAGYKWLNDGQRKAVKLLKAKKLTCKVVTDEYAGGEKNLMGYYTWGSNHCKFDSKAYKNNTFYPGAIAETIVSTSARTFTPKEGGQSLITDLIRSGVTGVKGYITEPYATAIAQSQILFDRYTSGFNLAESFYAASPFLHWMDIVIGDPLCSPWENRRAASQLAL